MPLGPQYSSAIGETLPSMKTVLVCPARNGPSSPQACRRWKFVSPGSGLTPKRSNSNCVLISPSPVGSHALTPKREGRTPAQKLPFSPNSFGNAGSFVGRSTSNQSGLTCSKS